MEKVKYINILKLVSIYFLILGCNSQTTSSDEDVALALLLLNTDATQSESGNCSLRENGVVTSGSPLRTQVNASSTRCWMLISLENNGIQIAGNEANWDLRFRRFVIGTNSGTSGSGQSAACDTGLTDFNVVNAGNKGNCSSNSEFIIDSIQTQEGAGFADVNDSANSVLFNWYSYNNTVLTAKTNVYIIRGSNGITIFKLQMLDYYSAAGTSGYPQFRWSRL